MNLKHLFVWIGIVAAAAPLMFASAGNGQDSFAIREDAPAFAYCYISHTGPFKDIGSSIGPLMQAMQRQNILQMISGPMVCVYDNASVQADPERPSWEIGFTVPEQAMPTEPLMKGVWNYPTVAVATHLGPYEKIGKTIGRLKDWIAAQGYSMIGPLLERYLNNPMQVAPEALRTEIWIAVEKK